jgi:Uma2 family endonuclease
VCGERLVSSIDKNAVVNPTLLVEVTSSSTVDYDRGEKLSHYKQCPSLQSVIFVSHRQPQLSAVVRTAGGWEQREHRAGEIVQLERPELSLAVDVYAGVDLGGSG